jgi:hypothetical protein
MFRFSPMCGTDACKKCQKRRENFSGMTDLSWSPENLRHPFSAQFPVRVILGFGFSLSQRCTETTKPAVQPWNSGFV